MARRQIPFNQYEGLNSLKRSRLAQGTAGFKGWVTTGTGCACHRSPVLKSKLKHNRLQSHTVSDLELQFPNLKETMLQSTKTQRLKV
jgi:hypothetical protein